MGHHLRELGEMRRKQDEEACREQKQLEHKLMQADKQFQRKLKDLEVERERARQEMPAACTGNRAKRSRRRRSEGRTMPMPSDSRS